MSLAKSIAVRGGFVFLAVAALVLGGLGWVTRQSLRLEQERAVSAENAERQEKYRQEQEAWNAKLKLALWRLDARMGPPLAREESRPYAHYSALQSPYPAIDKTGEIAPPGKYMVPSPLLTSEFADWILLHFQIDPTGGWSSPEVIPSDLLLLLTKPPLELRIRNATPEREKLLCGLRGCYPSGTIIPQLQARGVVLEDPQSLSNNEKFNYYNANKMQRGNSLENNAPSPTEPNTATQPQTEATRNSADFQKRMSVSRGAANDNRTNEYRNYWNPNGSGFNRQPVDVVVGSMTPLWLPSPEKPEQLLLVRAGKAGTIPVYQGYVIDWPRLQELLRDEIADLFEKTTFRALPEVEPLHPERAMSTLPIELEVSDPAPQPPGLVTEVELSSWTPLRFGLGVAWLSTLIALSAVGLVGWSLMSLSERRIRFVSAVTHELRTPMTTIRLYLDMLQQGMVTEEKQRSEYIGTLNDEADRLNRLIGNVLDYARLEKKSIAANNLPVSLAEFLESIGQMWRDRCRETGKELILENSLEPEFQFTADPQLLERVLSNLIDNSRKYSIPARDSKIWLRAVRSGDRLRFEVEDRGPGVPRKEWGSIFRAFRRGEHADVQAGGVGLGLALAAKWTKIMGGKLKYEPPKEGARFIVELPIG